MISGTCWALPPIQGSPTGTTMSVATFRSTQMRRRSSNNALSLTISYILDKVKNNMEKIRNTYINGALTVKRYAFNWAVF